MDEKNNFLNSYSSDNKDSMNKKVSAEDNGMAFSEKSTFKAVETTSVPSGHTYKKDNTLRNVLISIFALAAVTFGIIFFLLPNINKIEVPAFKGWSKNDFILWANENNVFPQIEEQYNDEVEIDRIQSQDKAEGETVKKGDVIKVLVSKGPDLSVELELPDIMNMTKYEIEEWAEMNYMSKVRITGSYSETVPLGNVISYEINDNTVVDTVRRNTPIYIIVSKGKEEVALEEIKVPDFKTMSLADCVTFAEENKIELIIQEEYNEYIAKNSVISQSVKKDTILHPKDEIKITVSLGKKVYMVSFADISKEKAGTEAANLGVKYDIIEVYSSIKEGKMISQSIDEGIQIIGDMELTLYYSLGNKILTGNYEGKKIINFEQWINGENEKNANLKVNIIYTQNSSPSGTIIHQDIKDTYILTGSQINLIVSSGKTYFVPNFVAPYGSLYDTAVTVKKAQELAEDLDIILVFLPEINSDRLQGEIWYQSISAGAEVNEGEIITLKYNPITETVTIPNFLGKTIDEIKQMDEYYALDIAFDYEKLAGKAYSQSIEEGVIVPYGTKINLKISPY